MLSRIKEILYAEQPRWELWLPFSLASGIAVYFLLPFEPPSYLGLILVLISVPFIFWEKKKQDYIFFSLFLFLFALGFAISSIRADYLSAPVLEKKTKTVTVKGEISSTDIKGTGQRLVFEQPEIVGWDKENIPHKIRIKVNGLNNKVVAGDKVELRAVLMPPPMPSMPSAYDIPRKFWFEQLGAVGYAVSKVKIISEASSFKGWLDRVRSKINFSIMDRLPKDEAGIAMSLVTGEQGGNSKQIAESYRASGIAHMLSVSGVHMSMLGGLVFGILRLFFALFPGICLRYNTKKISAAIAIIITFCYLLISGMAIPAQRSFIMVTVVLVAVILDKQAISMRSIGIAMILVLLIHPEALVSASFQMSFAAVYALIAAFEIGAGKLHRNLLKDKKPKNYLLYLLIIWILGTAVTDFVASSATTPFAIYHFNRYATYSMLCNLLTAPILGIVVMPALLVAMLLLPFNLASYPLDIAGFGINLMNKTALWIESLPHSVFVIPAMPAWGLGLAVIGGAWLCLWQTRWRLLGLIPIALGMMSPLTHKAPDLITSQGGGVFAVLTPESKLLIEPSRGDKMAKETWLSKNGEDYNAYDTKKAKKLWLSGFTAADGDPSFFCSSTTLCHYKAKGKHIAIAYDYDALKEACATADIVISKVNAKKEYCRAPYLIERKGMWKSGSHAVWLEKGGNVTIRSSADEMGSRPWTPK